MVSRLANRIQLTSDGHRAYLTAVDTVFGDDVDYAQLVKIYGADPIAEKRYSLAKCLGARRQRMTGNPDPDHISTSYAERQNLTMRMHMRRFTRLTNAFSKKLENHAHSMALFAMYYNFVRLHQTLRVSPAMAAGVTDRIWEIGDVVKVLEDWEAAQAIKAPTVFQIRKLDVGEGYYIRVTMPDGKTDAIYSFDDPIQAQQWIDAESRGWLTKARKSA